MIDCTGILLNLVYLKKSNIYNIKYEDAMGRRIQSAQFYLDDYLKGMILK